MRRATFVTEAVGSQNFSPAASPVPSHLPGDRHRDRKSLRVAPQGNSPLLPPKPRVSHTGVGAGAFPAPRLLPRAPARHWPLRKPEGFRLRKAAECGGREAPFCHLVPISGPVKWMFTAGITAPLQEAFPKAKSGGGHPDPFLLHPGGT